MNHLRVCVVVAWGGGCCVVIYQISVLSIDFISKSDHSGGEGKLRPPPSLPAPEPWWSPVTCVLGGRHPAGFTLN